jgi:hypothetical protein
MKRELRRARPCVRCLVKLAALLAVLVVILTRRRRTMGSVPSDIRLHGY